MSKINYEIVELEDFSGSEATVYSIIPKGEDETLFDKFVSENITEHRKELKEILSRIKQIGETTGAREIFFKPEGDSAFMRKYGKYIYALYDEEESNLRLYCIKFSSVAIILGGGGFKDKSVIKWQDDLRLSNEVKKVMAYAACILKQLDVGDLYWSKNGMELEGNLKNYDDEQNN
ncbi:MAG: hypothetical protein R2798_02080 [Chitinophagales bacterium]|nr:hypothetical protein [Bacteroidota bacterium]